MKNSKLCTLHFAVLQICILAAIGLQSCGLYGKYQPQHPEADSITTPSYTEIFTDPQLQSLIEHALINNLDLKIAHERVNEASAIWKGSKLAYIPTLGLQAEYGGTGAIPGSPTSVGPSAGVTLDWSLDIFGRYYNRMKIAGADRLSTADREQLARAELIASVATGYYRLLMLDAQILTADSMAAIYNESVQALRAMKDAGMTDEAAVAQYEGNYYGVLVQGEQLRLERHEAENALRLLLSDPAYGEIRRQTISETTSNYDLTTVPLSALLTRPDVRYAEHQLERAFYGVQLSRANCCPDITLSGILGFNGNFLWSAVGGLLQPLFSADRFVTGIRTARSQNQQAEYAYTAALVNAAIEVNDALAARRSYADRVEDNLHRQQAFERAYDATATKFRLGQGSYLESLIALQQVHTARLELIENYGNVLISQVNLYLSLGGGR